MSLSTEEIQQLQNNFTKIDNRFQEISKLLPFNKVLSVDELNTLLHPLYESLLKTGIIDQNGIINQREVFSNFPETHYKSFNGNGMVDSLYSIEYDDETACGILIWNGYVSSQEFRYINENFLEFAREHKITKMIRDTRNFTILSPADRKWFAEYMIPQFHAIGIRFSAIIIPNNQISKLLVEELVKHANVHKIQVKYFSTLEEAKSWLCNV